MMQQGDCVDTPFCFGESILCGLFAHGFRLEFDQGGNQGQAVRDAMIYFGQQHLGTIAGTVKLGGTALNALLQASIDIAYLVARLTDLAGIAGHGDEHDCDYEYNERSTEDRYRA